MKIKKKGAVWMAGSITTYTNKTFTPSDPQPEAICIEDIAHALSLLCRGNGHCRTFYSVGQHCLACAREAEARGYSPKVVLAALLHDASECYLSDVPHPYKAAMPEYVREEDRIMTLIYEKFLGSQPTAEEAAQVKDIDRALMFSDLEALLHGVHHPEAENLLLKVDYTVRPFSQVEEEYLALYKKLETVIR